LRRSAEDSPSTIKVWLGAVARRAPRRQSHFGTCQRGSPVPV